MGDKTQEDYNKASQERTDGEIGNVAIPNGSTGEDANGFVFANLEELGAVVQQWHTESEALAHDGNQFRTARNGAMITATDVISAGYFDTVCSVLEEFIEHNMTMNTYTNTYVRKLSACQSGMAESDDTHASEMNNVY